MSTYAFDPDSGPPIPTLIGSSAAMQQVYRTIRRVARSSASVLLLGETGTGKELVATALHRLSSRRGGPFVRVNCGRSAKASWKANCSDMCAARSPAP